MKQLLEKSYNVGKYFVYNDKPEFDVIECKQVHSNIVLSYTGNSLSKIEADGIIIDPKIFPNTCLAIKTADCLPILLVGEKIALIHAGWKGLANHILNHELLSCESFHSALIGPSIHDYEVTEEFKQNFSHSKNFYQKDQLYFDLQAEAKEQILNFFPNTKVEISSICTLKNIEYNSYRRDKTTKRNWNLFKIN